MTLPLRAFFGFATMFVLMWLVWLQIKAANTDGYLTVEQLVHIVKRKALSFDRHYAIVIDFCIIPGTVALSIVLCGKQWDMLWSGGVTAVVTIVVLLFCLFVLWIGGTEAHVHDRWPTTAGFLHAAYAAIAGWVMAMVLINTPKPEPVLLLILCIVVPAFFFVGTHKFLGMINFAGAAATYPDQPLKDPIGWAVIVVATGATWWWTYELIPTSFWESLK